jgi:FlaA1/EpsC-like NDP-sugar epimerase
LHSDFRPSHRDYEEFWHYLPRIVLPQLLMLVWRGQLRGLMSYFSIPEMRRTGFLLAIALLIQVALCMPAQSGKTPSPSILLMDFILSFFTICAVRMTFRLQREWIARSRQKPHAPVKRVAIIGAGELATNLVLDFARSENPTREVVAFFDDDPRTWHKRPHNIPVIGMPECLLAKEWLTKIDEVIVTLPEEDSERLREIKQLLKSLPLKVILASGWPALKTLEETK